MLWEMARCWCSFAVYEYIGQRRNERGLRGKISRAPNHHGARIHCVGRRRVPTLSQVLSSIRSICFWKTSGSNMGAPSSKLAYCPVRHLTLFRPWHGAQKRFSKLYINILIFAKQWWRPPSKWCPWHVPCLLYPRYVTGSAITPVMESRDLVSVSRLASTPVFASLGLEGFRSRLGLEGYRSRDFEYCKEMV